MLDRQSVIEERLNRPDATLQQIGDKYGVNKERVRQILAAENLSTHHQTPRYFCNCCGEIFHPQYNRSKTFCSRDCRKAYNTATLECEGCGRLYSVSYASLIRNIVRYGQHHFYCSRSCFGRVIGQRYGFRVHPKNSGPKNRPPSKWAVYKPQIEAMFQSGYHIYRILRELGIPQGSLSLIKKMLQEKDAFG